MSTVAKSPSKVQIDDAIKCGRCGSIRIQSTWIDDYEVLHCICMICDNEWVQ